jgi:hypothetical protein
MNAVCPACGRVVRLRSLDRRLPWHRGRRGRKWCVSSARGGAVKVKVETPPESPAGR